MPGAQVQIPFTVEINVTAGAPGGTVAVTASAAVEQAAPAVAVTKSAVVIERQAKIIKLDQPSTSGSASETETATHFVLGIVLEPDPEGGDTQGHTYSKESVMQAAYGFMKNAQVVGYMHKDVATGVAIVESYIQRGDTTINEVAIKDGSWVMGVEITNADLWQQIEDGEINAFSIGGEATETELPAAAA